MNEPWAQLADPDAERAWAEVLRPVAAEFRAHAPQMARALVDQMQAALPGVMPDAETVAENVVSTEQTICSLADVIDTGADPRLIPLPRATLAFAEAGAHRQVPSAVLVRAYRLGHEFIWQWFFDRIVARCPDGAELATATALLTRWTFAYADTAITQVEQAVEQERERWLRSTLAARGAAIAAIVSGEERDADRASQRLRYTVQRDHVGIAASVATASAADGDPQDLLSETVATLAATVRADAQLIYPTGVTTCVAWISRARGFTNDELAALTSVTVPDMRIAVGEPGSGLDGFRRSHLEAGHARRVAADTNLTGVVRYADVAVAALASIDPEQAAAFVHRLLGPLTGTDEVTRRAAEALTIYLEENRSRHKAAARLHIHPNTVTYRVQQAQQILGRDIEPAALDLRVALALLPAVRAMA